MISKYRLHFALAKCSHVRIAIACELYRLGEISLGKACEVAVKWAYENKLIKKPTKCSFAKYVVLTAIEGINDKINGKNTLNVESTAGMPSEKSRKG